MGYSQTNVPPPFVTNSASGLLGTVELIGKTVYDAIPTNFAVVPYLTYAPSAPKQYGGGALAIYNVSQNVGAGLGLDWLGSFQMVSANVEFKVPVYPLRFLGSTGFVHDFQATPFAITGISSPISGGLSGHIGGIVGAGAYVDVARLLGGEVSLGGGLTRWTDVGLYSGNHYQAFIGWRKGF